MPAEVFRREMPAQIVGLATLLDVFARLSTPRLRFLLGPDDQ